MNDIETDVLVVGMGPAGLAAAATLGRHGVATIVVEQRNEPPALPRATVISTRAMEVLRGWGLEARVRGGGIDGDAWMWECETLASARRGTAHPVGYPTREQAAVVSPTAPGIVPQDWLEAVLRAHVASFASVTTELGTELIAIDGDAVTVRGRTGEVRTIRARYVIGADGAASRVRDMVGIEMESTEGADLSGVQVVFRAPLWQVLGDLRYVLYSVTTPAAPGIFLPAGPTDRWVYGPGRADVDPSQIADQIRAGVGVDVDIHLERIGAFTSRGQVAKRFRSGSTFLAGDAAHRVTPRGGTGMNLAFLGGHDLGWKLAWVVRGWAPPEMLNTYEQERRIAAEHNSARSTDPNGTRRFVTDELSVDLGGRIGHAWLPASAGSVSTLDLLGDGWTLFTTDASTEPKVRGFEAPVTVRLVDPMTARRLGMTNGDLLVRPDGVPFALTPLSLSAA